MVANLLRKMHKPQDGVGRITLAILAIACLAVIGLLAYANLSSDNGSVTVYGTENSNALELRGAVFAMCDPVSPSQVNEIVFVVGLPDEAAPVNFTEPPNNVVQISYIDAAQQVDDIPWVFEEYIPGDGDAMLEKNESFLITARIGSVLNPGLGADTPFSIEVKTPDGETLTFKRATPDQLIPVMNFQ